MACYPESVDTGRQRESSKPVYLVMSVLEDKLLFCLKKKKNLKSYKFYHQTIIQHRWIDEMESLSEMRQNILSSWMETPVPDIV